MSVWEHISQAVAAELVPPKQFVGRLIDSHCPSAYYDSSSVEASAQLNCHAAALTSFCVFPFKICVAFQVV